jgi:hypothetical protein
VVRNCGRSEIRGSGRRGCNRRTRGWKQVDIVAHLIQRKLNANS